ncbi:hypothetical protein WICMUC_000900 [Wickerhamomyces mucosus]|uniref:non-specific serine/threonine protein kinase n=1 Tax=Wickerhamomyces mucosus TaxID=1378264 RepID=A0A9P8PWQ3_9ASCO|nr:hypothetical protein WICMUC_000900 [Wickerhamomyces mucosus]
MAETKSRQSFRSKKPHKEIRFGSYVLGSTLGEGEFGKVKLGWKKDGSQPSQVAIKFIRRDSIPKGSEKESKVHREINALKRLSHPNIITLEEVLQNDKYIGIVLDYASGGELFDYILSQRYLKDSFACRLFAQLISGVHYMHSKGIVHRDLKLENLLLDKHKNIIITDFGFVNSFTSSNELMKTSCGSPCYAAPELVISNDPYEARKVDVWSCGVILYAMLAGYLPFDDDPQNPDGDNIARLYQYITTTPLTFPEYIEPMPRDLLRKVLVANPRKRVTLKEVRSHQWLSQHAPFLSVTPIEWDKNHKNSTKSSSSQHINLTNKNHNRRYSLIDTASTSKVLPLPPQTSSNHAVALPSSASSQSISEQVNFNPRENHQRSDSIQSYSSASLALQAVFDANDYRSQAIPSSSSQHSIDRLQRDSEIRKSPPTVHHSLFSTQQPHIPRSTTHTGVSSIYSSSNSLPKHPIIEESPQKNTSFQPISSFAIPKIPDLHVANSKLPGPGTRKPRPTSFHPRLYPSQDTSNQIISSSTAELTQTFGRTDSSSSATSFTNYKISDPSVDLASAEGDIITPKSPTLIVAETIVKIPTEKLDHNLHNETDIQSKENNENLAESDKRRSESSQSKRTNRYSAIIAAESVIDKFFGSSSPNEPTQIPEVARSNSRHSSVRSSSSKPSASTNPLRTKNTSAYESSKNTACNKQAQSTASKSKRFSFLSFYSSESSPLPESHSTSTPAHLPTPPAVSRRKVLETSNAVNITQNASEIEPKQDSSVIEYTSFEPKKEPSTAKKVMDFFKRRSMRIG